MALGSRYSFLERLNINSIYNVFLGLPPQQQTFAMIGAGLLLLFIILLPISLSSGKIGRMEKTLKRSNQDMGSIVFEIEDYDKAKSQLKTMEEGLESGFDTALPTTLESLASNAGIQENIDSIKERPVVSTELFDESVVEVRLSKVTLKQLIDFLYSIEYDKKKLLRVNELRMKTRFDDKQLFDVSFQVSTYRLQQQEG